MLLAADLSQRLGWLGTADVDRVRELLRALGLPTDAPAHRRRAGRSNSWAWTRRSCRGRIRLVLLRRLGEGVVTGDYPAEALQATLRAHFEVAA